ncbi:hypothetical protein [Dyella acidisoli]|uniref:Uncharacterized protein n=1 Tax=Dyella acidisoli TaxID=1867834 RepID=A0ABQ5XSR2_9GAMM|nr:hypothetical protein [Dyella acidisoli]GLQ93797.1 hypothetical protein GCM10007901_27480 [Dyella acidisoli]
MIAGKRLAMVVGMLGAIRLASGADITDTSPDALATRVQTLLHQHYAERDKLAVVDRVLTIEKRIGAYRAAHTKAELIYRINVDLWVATKDHCVSVREQSGPPVAGVKRYELGSDLVLSMPDGTFHREQR